MAGEGDAPELGTPVGEDPSCGDPGCGEPFDDKVQEHGCRLGGVVTGYEIDDGPAGVGIDCGELPHRPDAFEFAHIEAVQCDQIPRSGSEMTKPEPPVQGVVDHRAAGHGGELRQSSETL